VHVARVGDSTAFVLAGGNWHELFSEGTEEPSLGATEAIPMRPSPRRPEEAELDLADGDALVLVSDGIANPLRDGPATVAPALAGLLARRNELAPLALAGALDFSRRGALDDRALVVAWADSSER
jgi:hypothetical protein